MKQPKPRIIETPAGSLICEHCATYVASKRWPDCRCAVSRTINGLSRRQKQLLAGWVRNKRLSQIKWYRDTVFGGDMVVDALLADLEDPKP